MTATHVFALLVTVCALILSLGSVQILVLRRGWRMPAGQAMFHFMGGLVLYQTMVLVMVIGLQVGLAYEVLERVANWSLISSFFITLAALALLLHAAHAMKEVWEIASRAGVVGILVLQPAIWRYDILRFPTPPDETLLRSPYTTLGDVVAVVSAGYIVLVLVAARRFWRQIDASLLIGSLLGLVVIQSVELVYSPLRELALTGAAGGIVSVVLVYYFLAQLDTDPRHSRSVWPGIVQHLAHILTSNPNLDDTLSGLAEQARQLVRTDTINVIALIGPDRLKVIASAGAGLSSALGRQIRVGEGLAGRVVQTYAPMRVDNYLAWQGKAVDFADLPIYASMSVPLIHNNRLVGVINASETSPGRAFTDRDQQTLALLAPQIAGTIVFAKLEDDLHTTRAYLQTIWDHTPTAMFIFDARGILREANAAARQILIRLFGDANPSAIELAAHAKTPDLTGALVWWMTDPTTRHNLEVEYDTLGRQRIELQPISNDQAVYPDLLVVMHPAE